MNIFITVGTTPFEELIRICDNISDDFGHWHFTAQTANSKYIPRKIEHFEFTNKIETHYKAADLIICHAGAGTVYKLLEDGKKIIVVPNTNRRENHQLELCKFLEDNNLALVVYNVNTIADALNQSLSFKAAPYHRDDNSLSEAVQKIILNLYSTHNQ